MSYVVFLFLYLFFFASAPYTFLNELFMILLNYVTQRKYG